MRAPISVRRYGDPAEPAVVLIHGGPGAPGYMAPVARELSARGFYCVEPLQRLASDDPEESLSVSIHIEDLRVVLQKLARPVVLLGSSWGAMLALAFAAEHPASVHALVLVGCGTFSQESRAEFQRRFAERGGEAMREALAEIERRVELGPNERLELKADAILDAYSWELSSRDLECVGVDALGNKQTWSDMLELQGRGVYPACFDQIDAPALLVHGDVDPHPGELVARELSEVMPRLEYIELGRCGHYPWLEVYGREPFFELVAEWLASVVQEVEERTTQRAASSR